MIHLDKTSLICDLAETYGIYDYRSLPVRTTAALASGLRDDSRIKTKLRGGKAETDTDVLIGLVNDRLADLLYHIGAYKKRPDSVALKLIGVEEGSVREGKKVKAFSSGEAFEKAYKRLLQKGP